MEIKKINSVIGRAVGFMITLIIVILSITGVLFAIKLFVKVWRYYV